MKASSAVRRDIQELLLNIRKKDRRFGKPRHWFFGGPKKKEVPRIIANLSYEEQVVLCKVLGDEIEREVSAILPFLANTGDSPSEIARFRSICPSYSEIADESDEEIISLRSELRTVWERQAKNCGEIFAHWYVSNPFLFFQNWLILFKAKTILPTSRNFRGMAANVCAERAEYLKRCANPECQQYFIADRKDGKYCLQAECIQYGGRVRSLEHWRRSHPKASSVQIRKRKRVN